jgi:hypothetical protein
MTRRARPIRTQISEDLAFFGFLDYLTVKFAISSIKLQCISRFHNSVVNELSKVSERIGARLISQLIQPRGHSPGRTSHS